MSEWQSPQDYPRRESDGVKRLVGAVQAVGEQVRESTSNLLRTAGIHLAREGMRISSALRVEGDLDATGVLAVTGDAKFSGDMAITGTLSLPAGIIDNEALANPVTFDTDWGGGEGYATPAEAWLTVGSATIAVPAGFTKMQFTAVGFANGLNSTSSTTNMYVQVHRSVNGAGDFASPRGQVALPAGFQGVASSLYVWSESVAPGEVHQFEMQVWTNLAYAASTFNYARLDVTALFTR